LRVKSGSCGWNNPSTSPGTLELKEIGSNFNTGAITTTYPQYSDHHHSKNPASWFTANPAIDYTVDITTDSY
jgi:hypothetical protein